MNCSIYEVLAIMDVKELDVIKNALNNLRSSQAEAEAALEAFEQHDLSKENAQLRETVDKLHAELKHDKEATNELRGAYVELAKNFKHELACKRNLVIGLSKRQHQEYLDTGLARERVFINEQFRKLQSTITHMYSELNKIDAQDREPLYYELNILRERIAEQARQAEQRRIDAWQNVYQENEDELNNIGSAPVPDAAMYAVRRFFAWETFLGLKIISAIGALLLLLGVFTFGRHFFGNIGPEMQNILIFVFGLALMIAGEVLYRKKWRGGFTIALTAGGSGVLFLGAALGYMTLGVLPMWVALCICAVVSLLTFGASLRYNAQLIAVFALFGGYLPIIALSESLVIFAAIYFTILSLLALLIATKKNWRIARFIGLGAVLVAGMVMMNVGYGVESSIHTPVFVAASIIVSFLAYIIIPVFGAWFTKTKIIAADIILLIVNVFFSYIWMLHWVFSYATDWLWQVTFTPSPLPADMTITFINHSVGNEMTIAAFVTAFFAITCIVMAVVSERQKFTGVPKSETGSLRALFFVTSISFVSLIVLFALDSVWFSAGWIIQATGLALYGIFRNRRRFVIAAIAIGGVCVFTFLTVNLTNHRDPLFVWQYLLITAALLAVSVAALRAKTSSKIVVGWLSAFRSVAIFNFWLYLVYVLHNQFFDAMTESLGSLRAAFIVIDDFIVLSSIMIGLVFAFVLPRIRYIADLGVRITAVVLGAVNILAILHFNAVYLGTDGLRGLDYWGLVWAITVFVLFILANIGAVGWLNDLLRSLTKMRRLSFGAYALIVSGFAVLLLIQNLVVQFDLRASSMVLTLIFGLTALAWVIYGFVQRNNVIRVGGLSMTFFAVAKLFILDLYRLETTARIVSYFVGGIVLLSIAFSYQWFNKRIAVKDKVEMAHGAGYDGFAESAGGAGHASEVENVHYAYEVDGFAEVGKGAESDLRVHKYCTNCGSELSPNMKFCTSCGAEIKL